MESKSCMKIDPNKEAFQMRAQWKKAEDCKKQWHKSWSWILEERRNTSDESDAIRKKMAEFVKSDKLAKYESPISLKPVPETHNRLIGWLAGRPDCQLEIYTSWLSKPPMRLPDVWQLTGYRGLKK